MRAHNYVDLVSKPKRGDSLFSALRMGFPGGASGKEPASQCRKGKRCGFDPWLRKLPWRQHDNPLQYSCLENPMGRGAWWATAHKLVELDTTEAT